MSTFLFKWFTYEDCGLALLATLKRDYTKRTRKKNYLRTPPLDTIGLVPDKNWNTFSSNLPSIAYWNKCQQFLLNSFLPPWHLWQLAYISTVDTWHRLSDLFSPTEVFFYFYLPHWIFECSFWPYYEWYTRLSREFRRDFSKVSVCFNNFQIRKCSNQTWWL